MFKNMAENRAQQATGSAWLVKHPDDTSGKFSLVGLTQSVPVPSGEEETIDIDVLQSSPTGKLGTGKITLEEVDVSVYDHRDNRHRYTELEGQTLDFLSILPDFSGYRFTATIKYVPQPPANGESPMANVHVVPVASSGKPILNTRGLIIEALDWANAIPDTVEVGKAVDFAVKQDVTPTFTIKKVVTDENGAETFEDATSSATNLENKITFTTEGLYIVTATADGYAPWVTTVYAETPKTTL